MRGAKLAATPAPPPRRRTPALPIVAAGIPDRSVGDADRLVRLVGMSVALALFGSETLPRLLGALAAEPDRRFTAGELEARVEASHDSTFRALQRAVSAGLVCRERGGRQFVYRIEARAPLSCSSSGDSGSSCWPEWRRTCLVDAEGAEFQRQLAEVARADDSLKQVGARTEVAVQKLQLARRWAHRAATIATLPDFADDPDFAFASMYQAFQDAADAFLCAHGWRPGGDPAPPRHFALPAA